MLYSNPRTFQTGRTHLHRPASVWATLVWGAYGCKVLHVVSLYPSWCFTRWSQNHNISVIKREHRALAGPSLRSQGRASQRVNHKSNTCHMYIIVYYCISLYIIVYPYVICPETYKIRITSIKITWHPKGFPKSGISLMFGLSFLNIQCFLKWDAKKGSRDIHQQFDRDLAIAND